MAGDKSSKASKKSDKKVDKKSAKSVEKKVAKEVPAKAAPASASPKKNGVPVSSKEILAKAKAQAKVQQFFATT